jgi:hypothetical protein|tara:strand:- start:314 stop:1645 length:1332 start_codon:yes stop_codon:yes gene_type:complete
MSNTAFESGFSNKLLKSLEKDMRRAVQRQSGQLLIIPGPKEIKKAIADTFPGQSIDVKEGTITTAIEKARQRAKGFQDLYRAKNPERFKLISARFNEIVPLPSIKLGKNAFIVTSFYYSVNQVKQTLLKHIQAQAGLSDNQRRQLSGNVHKGHGMRGSAVSQVQIASSIGGITKDQEEVLANNFQSYAKQANLPSNIRHEIKKIFSRHSQMVGSDGTLLDEYFSIVEFQLGKENIGVDAAHEKLVLQTWKKFVASDFNTDDMLNQKGSGSLLDKIEDKVVLKNLTKGKNVVATKRKKPVKGKTSNKTQNKGAKEKVTAVSLKAGGRRTKARAVKGVSSSPLALLGVLNQKLPETVRKNMNSPALVNRTGRFADSVKVVDMNQTPQGFPSIGYTYQRNPYEVFEDGNGSAPWANGNRDPRQLIDKSIREIAMQFAIGRFYTRRL